MAVLTRVIIDKPMPGGRYRVGESYLLPNITAKAWIAQELCHVATAEDFARQQIREETARKKRVEAKKKTEADNEAHAKAVAAARPLVEAKDALAAIAKRLDGAERRHAAAAGKQKTEWGKTVKGIKAERKVALAAVAKLTTADPKPEPGTDGTDGTEPGTAPSTDAEGEGAKPQIQMS